MLVLALCKRIASTATQMDPELALARAAISACTDPVIEAVAAGHAAEAAQAEAAGAEATRAEIAGAEAARANAAVLTQPR